MPTLTLSLNGATGKTNKWSDVSTPLNQVGTLLNTTRLDHLNIQANGVRTGQVRSHAGVLQRRAKVRNATGGSLAAADIVAFAGTYSDGTDSYPLVVKADSAAPGSWIPAWGIMEDAPGDDADGSAAQDYELSGINTSGQALHAPVYLSATAGEYTFTAPASGNVIQIIGKVTNVSASEGRVIFSFPGIVVPYGLLNQVENVTRDVALTSDVTIYDDQNNADTSLTMGTSAAESLSIQVLNGSSNKTAEEIKFVTATASGTANHGKMTFNVDGTDIGSIDDGGIDLVSGKKFSINGTDLPTPDTAVTFDGSTANGVCTFKDANEATVESNLTFTGSALTVIGTVTVGANDAGHDVILYGDTDGANLTWDTSADKLLTSGGAVIDVVKDKLLIGGTAVTTTAAELNVLDAVTAGTVAVSKAVVVDGSKNIGTFGTVTAGTFTGALNGNASTATALASARTIGGVSFDGTGNINLPGVNTAGNQNTSGTAAVATAVTITDNESTNETNAIVFTSGGDVDGGDIGLESDGDLTYNPSSGLLSATAVTATGAVNTGALTSTGNISFDGGSFVFNESGADKDFRIEGDTNANLFVADASEDKIGFGTATPGPGLVTLGGGVAATTVRIDIDGGSDNGKGAQLAFRSGSTDKFYVGDAASLQGGSESSRDMTLYTTSGCGIRFYTGRNNRRMDITSAGAVYINETANTDMTIGLTINQGTNDDEILALKGSEVGHPATAVAEADTYGAFKKSNANGGGLHIMGFSEPTGTSNNNRTLLLTGVGGNGTGDASHTVFTAGVVTIDARKTDGSTGTALVADTEAAIVLTNYDHARMVLLGDGDLHITNTTLTALDGEDDNQLVRAMQRASSSGGVRASKHDNPFYNYDKLLELGLAGEADENGTFLYPLQKRLHAHEGAMWQTYCTMLDMSEKVETLQLQLNEANDKLARLEMN